MNEINIKLSSEQIALLNKVLEPYVMLYKSINDQYLKNQKIKFPPTAEELDEIATRS